MTKTSASRFFKIAKPSLLAAMILLLGGKWYAYVAHADSPFEDFGSGLNAMMPGPINRYGCEMLKKRFGDLPIPPRGCDVDGQWK